MKFALPLLRSIGMALAWAFVVCAVVRAQDDLTDWSVGHTQISDTAAKKKDTSAVTLAPDLEKKLQDLLDKAKAKKGEYWDDQMKKEIDDIAKLTGLQDWMPLNAAAKQAVTASLDAYAPKLPDMFRRQIALIPKDQALAMLDQAQEQIGALAETDMTGEMVAPDEQDVWVKALHQTLTPAQFDMWSQAQTKHKEDVEKEINDVLKNGADRTRDQETQTIQEECRKIEIALNLPKDRSDKLDDLGKAAVDQSVAAWRKRVEKSLLAMDENQRRPMLSNGFYMGTEANESPTEQPAWKDGVAQLLTADDRVRLQYAQDARRAKRVRVMGQVMVMLLDEKLALTEAQRQKLQPIADRLVKDIPDLYPENGGPNAYYSFSPDLFYATTAKAGDAELKPILDGTQLKRWKTLATPENVPLGNDGTAKPADSPEPEDVEKAVSAFFYEKSEKERQRALAANTLKAEDIARVAGVNAESAERLQAAARGATEEHLATWKWFTEQQIRSQLQDLTPQNVRERLAGMQDFFFQRNFGAIDRNNVWDATVQTELSAQQQDAWKKETDARNDYRGNAIAALVLAEFDRRSELTDDQWNKLQPLIAGVINDYSQGITQVFSGMNGVPWYMGGPYVLIPFAGLDDKDLKAILTKDQIDMWTGSQDYANATNLWQVVRQVTTQRARQNARAMIQD
jgi:hypothetical protein